MAKRADTYRILRLLGLMLFFFIVAAACGGNDGNFIYVVRVRDKNTNRNLPNANVIVEVPGQLPLDGITDVNGIVSILIPNTYAQKQGRILVESQGYDSYRQEINLLPDMLPDTIQLERTGSITPTEPEATVTVASMESPSGTPELEQMTIQAATVTPIPTATETPSATPTDTAVPTPTETPSPTVPPTAVATRVPPTPVVPLQPVSPQAGETVPNAEITFEWNGPDSLQYEIFLRHVPSGPGFTRSSGMLESRSWTYILPGDMTGEWRWKVIASNGEESEERHFWFGTESQNGPTIRPPGSNSGSDS